MVLRRFAVRATKLLRPVPVPVAELPRTLRRRILYQPTRGSVVDDESIFLPTAFADDLRLRDLAASLNDRFNLGSFQGVDRALFGANVIDRRAFEIFRWMNAKSDRIEDRSLDEIELILL